MVGKKDYIHPVRLTHPYSIFPLGDSVLVLDFGNRIDPSVNSEVLQLFASLHKLRVPFITDMIPAYSSLAICYDVQKLGARAEGTTAFDFVAEWMEDFTGRWSGDEEVAARQLRVPVCYEREYAPDMETTARTLGLATKELVALHTSCAYRVYMIGFMPGFAYMGEVPERMAIARRTLPRSSVPSGSVGVAGRQTGIYPAASPGGWQLIGRTPISVFNRHAADPVYFHPGDEVTFYPISAHEFRDRQEWPA